MDREHFDALARLVSAKQSRRGALAALLGAALLGRGVDAVSARRRKRKRRGHGDDDDNGGGGESPLCFQGSPCLVKPGANLRDCDFAGSAILANSDCQGCILSGANLAGAILSGANLQGAILADACLVNADLTDANVAGVHFDKTIICGTAMPDGSINNSGCDRSTRCCSPGGQGGGGQLNVRAIVENLTGADFDFEGWSKLPSDACKLIQPQTIVPNDAVTFQPNSPFAYAQFFFDIDSHVKAYLVEVVAARVFSPSPDTIPDATVGHSGFMSSQCAVSFTDVVLRRPMGVGQKFTQTIDGHQFEVLREGNIDTDRVFRIRVHS